MSREDYEDLIDARDHALAMKDIAAGAPTVHPAELDDYLAAPTPLAFWRKRAGKTQAALAGEAGLSEAVMAQIESGQSEGTVSVLARLARALGLRVDDLIEA